MPNVQKHWVETLLETTHCISPFDIHLPEIFVLEWELTPADTQGIDV